MFYETKVLDAYGNLKRIISSKELQTRHWRKFHEAESNLSINPKKESSKLARKKRYTDLIMDHH